MSKPLTGLVPGEVVQWYGHPTRLHFIRTYLIGILILILITLFPVVFLDYILYFLSLPSTISLILIFAGVVGLLLFTIAGEIRVRRIRYFITSRRYIREYKFISRRSEEITPDDVTDIDFEQGTIQKIFNYGNVSLMTAGSLRPDATTPGIIFWAVRDPATVARIASSVRSKYEEPSRVVERVVMVCPGCGAHIPEDSSFCLKCGKKLK